MDFVKGDDDSKDITRVLRVPGTLNRKYDPPRPVRLLSGDWDEYNLNDLVDAMPPIVVEEEKTITSISIPKGNKRVDKWFNAALEAECNAIAAMPPDSGRNSALNTAAYKLGGYIGYGIGDENLARQALITAGINSGLLERDVIATVKSGLGDGMAKPRKPPKLEIESLLSADVGLADFDDDDVADVIQSLTDGISAPPKTTTRPKPERAKIRTNGRQLRDVGDDAIAALLTQNETYIRGGELVRIRIDEKGAATLDTITIDSMRTHMTMSADFFTLKVTRDEERIETPTSPPLDAGKYILSRGTWPFSPIVGVIESPIMRADGSVIEEAGYDAASRLYYQPQSGFVMEHIKDAPSQEDAIAALEVLRELLIDFPFADASSADNAIAAILSLVGRELFDIQPLLAIGAPQQGMGKTLLAECIVMVGDGKEPKAGTAPTDPEEWRKRITSELMTGQSAILFDNITQTLDDASLASVTTSAGWSDRNLGSLKQIQLTNRAMFIVTANNLRVGAEFASRVYPVNLDARMSRPQEREGFKHPDIKVYTRQNRGKFVAAALTMCRAWIVAGKPEPLRMPRIRHPKWQKVIGGILHYAGAHDFLGNLQEFVSAADDDTPVWEAFILALKGAFGDMPTTAGMIHSRALASEELAATVPDELQLHLTEAGKAKFVQSLGYALKRRKGKRHGDSGAMIVVAHDVGRAHSKNYRFTVGE